MPGIRDVVRMCIVPGCVGRQSRNKVWRPTVRAPAVSGFICDRCFLMLKQSPIVLGRKLETGFEVCSEQSTGCSVASSERQNQLLGAVAVRESIS